MSGSKTPSNSSTLLSNAQVVIALFAGLASVIFLTGGIVLALRLLFAGLPSLSVAGLPREFLFSTGATHVVLPAIGCGVVAGVLDLGQRHTSIERGHLPWAMAMHDKHLRRTYLAFYTLIPFVLIAPGLGAAVANDGEISNELAVLSVLGAVVGLDLVVWLVLARRSRIVKTRPSTYWRRFAELHLDERQSKDGQVTKLAICGGVVPILFAVWLWRDVDDVRYFGIIGAWLVSLFFVLLAVWMRSQVGREHRREAPPNADSVGDLHVAPAEAGDGAAPADGTKDTCGPRPRTALILRSWMATAVLTVPAFLALAAASTLPQAAVCTQTKDGRALYVRGLFVGETAKRIYVGDTARHRIISVPSGAAHQAIGGDAARALGPEFSEMGALARAAAADKKLQPAVLVGPESGHCFA